MIKLITAQLQTAPEPQEAEKVKDARMTVEQLGELGEALMVVSARSSCLKERKELRAVMEENLSTGEVRVRIPRLERPDENYLGSRCPTEPAREEDQEYVD